MNQMLSFIISIVAFMSLSGCASQQLTATIPQGVDLNGVSSFYVVHFGDEERGLDKMISDELNNMGSESSYGEEDGIPVDVDAVVRYEDHWQWDITNYMISITITMRQTDETLLATGTSYRTSLVRKDPPEMIKETLNRIFSKNKS